MTVPVFSGKVTKEGKLVFPGSVRASLDGYLRTLPDESVDVTIRKHKSQRSVDQNAYWWAVPVRLLADHCGYSDAQMHYALLGECFGYVVGPTGKEVPNVASSSKLTTDEFTRLIEWVLVWGPTELGVEIPPPERVAA